MKYTFNQEPSNKEALKTIEQGMNGRRTIIVAGKCTVDYSGRTRSFLPEGDRIIIRKPDGTFLVHTDEKRKPLNWQPPGASCSLSITDEKLLVKTENTSPHEIIEVEFSEIQTVSTYAIVDDQEIEKFGTEENIQDYVAENPEYVEDGLKIIEDEWKMDVGSVDLFAEDESGNPVIIEIKRRRVGPKAVQQLRRYVEDFENQDNRETPRGILMSPSVTDSARKQIERYNFEHIDVPSNMENKNQSTKITDFD
jgi:RecB family endonuclease NucS